MLVYKIYFQVNSLMRPLSVNEFKNAKFVFLSENRTEPDKKNDKQTEKNLKETVEKCRKKVDIIIRI